MQPGKWWIGLPPLAILFAVAATMIGEKIEADIAGRARSSLARAQTPQALADAALAIEGRDVTLSGTALLPEAVELIVGAIERQDGVRSVLDKTAPPALARPFAFSVERRGKTLVLAGHEPPGERERIRAAAAGKGFEIADEAVLARGAPANFAALASYAVGVLDALGDGKVAFSGASLTATGAPASFDAYDRALAALDSPPAGIEAKAVDVTPPGVTPFVWSAVKSGASLSLFGYAPTPAIRAALASEAAALAGAGTVADQSRVASGAPAEFAAAARLALGALAGLDSGKAALADASLSIEGSGKPNVAPAAVEAGLRAALPKGFALGETKIAAGVASPYVLTARKQDETLALSGYAPDDATRARLVASARRRFGGEIAAGVDLAAGAPAGFAKAAEAALRAVARLRTGAAAISDRRIAIEGAAYTAPAAADIKTRLASETPEGFEASALVGVASPADPITPAELRATVAKTVAPGFSFSADHTALAEDSLPIADALGFALLRSPSAVLEIIGYFDGAGSAEENQTIARRRAETLRDYLIAAGVAAGRLRASSGAAAGGDAPHRRIEFMVE
ncbi:OmpA family protein [Methylosinus sp. Sm6]|nr:OmpA family protein [Methylosinus sp. Sm6]